MYFSFVTLGRKGVREDIKNRRNISSTNCFSLRFEGSRSATPERTVTPDSTKSGPSSTQSTVQAGSTAGDLYTAKLVQSTDKEEEEEEEKSLHRTDGSTEEDCTPGTGVEDPDAEIIQVVHNSETQSEPIDSCDQVTKSVSESATESVSEDPPPPPSEPAVVDSEPEKDISRGAIPKKFKQSAKNLPPPPPAASESDPAESRAELRGLKEFTQKYLAENSARAAAAAASDASATEALSDDIGEAEEAGMAPTIRRNSGGAYTSYVFISAEPGDEVGGGGGSVVSSSGSSGSGHGYAAAPTDRVTVNLKEC